MNENNDIIKMLRDREGEFHLPLREDGWKKLEAGLAAGQVVPPLQAAPSSVVVRHWPKLWWSVAAVGFLCLLVSVPLFMHKAPEKTLSDKSEKAVSQPVLPTQKEEKQLAKEAETTERKPATAIPVITSKPVLTSAPVALPELMPELQLTDTTVVLPQPAELYASGDMKKSHKFVGPQPERKSAVFDYQLGESTRLQKQRWSFGIQGGSNALTGGKGGLSHMEMELTENNPGPKPPPPPPEPPITDPGDTEENVPSGNCQTKAAIGGGSGGGNSDTYYYYRHRLPVTFSLSLRRNLFSRLAVETGISYTYLHSDVLEERRDNIGSQKLHYVGIPLKLSWTFFDSRLFSLYAAGGGLIEYCVSATHSEKDLNIQRWQPSWNASVGMQVTMLKPWSLYVEPGVSYYYNLNPNIRGSLDRFETIRSVHPFTFNLQVGIRFTY